MYLLCTRINRESPYSSKFPECKQMINEACVFSNCFFIFFWISLFAYQNNFIEVMND